MITIATDERTKARVRRYAQAAGVDLTAYVNLALSAAMERDDLVARTFAPLDALIDDAERGGEETAWPPESTESVSEAESEKLARALSDFFGATPPNRGVA